MGTYRWWQIDPAPLAAVDSLALYRSGTHARSGNQCSKGIKLAKLMWVITIIMSIIGAVVSFGGMMMAKSAPQEAAAAAMGLSCAVIPYCIARAFTEIRSL